MKLGDIVNRVIIDVRKFTAYALDPDNPIGRHKALIFERRLEFTKDNHAQLQQQIEMLALGAEAQLQRTDHYDQHYRVDLAVTGMAGQQEMIRTGWLVPSDRQAAYLITTFVLRKR